MPRANSSSLSKLHQIHPRRPNESVWDVCLAADLRSKKVHDRRCRVYRPSSPAVTRTNSPLHFRKTRLVRYIIEVASEDALTGLSSIITLLLDSQLEEKRSLFLPVLPGFTGFQKLQSLYRCISRSLITLRQSPKYINTRSKKSGMHIFVSLTLMRTVKRKKEKAQLGLGNVIYCCCYTRLSVVLDFGYHFIVKWF